jgi:hypothetical protein
MNVIHNVGFGVCWSEANGACDSNLPLKLLTLVQVRLSLYKVIESYRAVRC